MLRPLHEHGSLKEYHTIPQVDKIDLRTLQEEKDAKTDIYNYAARFDSIPEILYGNVTRRRTKIHEVTVRLSEQHIEVTGRGTDARSAEVAAALRFRQAAEKYQAQCGDGSLFIKESTALTTDSVRKFFDFYRIAHPDKQVKILPQALSSKPEAKMTGKGSHQVQVCIDGVALGQGVVIIGKKKSAEDLALLTAALEIKKKEPEIFPRFIAALTVGNGEILKPVSPVNLEVDEDCQLAIRETLLKARRAGLPDNVTDLVSDEDQVRTEPRYMRPTLSKQALEIRNQKLERSLNAFLNDPKNAELRRKKSELPMNLFQSRVLNLISENTYSIVVGSTGSGKTTQVPQIILEDAISKHQGGACNIICTQPRRIAATSVARRVAEERNESLRDSVGYHVRFDAKLPQVGGSITYCTTGILLQQLQHHPDGVMDGVSHLVIDEVHERDILIDFLLVIIKKSMANRAAAGKPCPKVVLMSATMDTELFASYFKTNVEGQTAVGCPSLTVPGRTFPVKEKYLERISKEMRLEHSDQVERLLKGDDATRAYLEVEDRFRKENPITASIGKPDFNGNGECVIDWKRERKITRDGETMISDDNDNAIVPHGLVAATIAHIVKTTQEGAVLVFLPGLDELIKVDELLKTRPLGVNFQDPKTFRISMLHSSLPAAQTEVFDAVPQGCRKIILATNIAETSITIPDVQFVVDTGKLREKQYDQMRRITQLKCTWISKSNSKQRAGRAGRVQNGNYYALFSQERYNSLRTVGLPEMLRSDLQDICLDIKAQAFKYPIRNFLADALEPPAPSSVDASVRNLQALEALTDNEQITPLGRLLASLPVHPSLGKMIVLGVIFRCLDPMLVLGAAAAERSMFLQPLEARHRAQEAKIELARESDSDQITIINAVREMRRLRDSVGDYAMRRFALEKFIHINTFKTIDQTAKSIEEVLVDSNLIPYTPEDKRKRSEYGDPSLNENSHQVALIKALTIAGLYPNLAVNTGGRLHRTPGEKNAIIHPSSVNANEPSKYGKLFSYSTMARSNDGRNIFLRDISEATPLMVSLFGGRLSEGTASNILEIDSWLPFFVKTTGFSSFTRAAKSIHEFRNAMERMLAGAFIDLKGVRKTTPPRRGLAMLEREDEGEKKYLADEEVRTLFAECVVEILGLDEKLRGESAALKASAERWKPSGPGTIYERRPDRRNRLNNLFKEL